MGGEREKERDREGGRGREGEREKGRKRERGGEREGESYLFLLAEAEFCHGECSLSGLRFFAGQVTANQLLLEVKVHHLQFRHLRYMYA